MSFRWLPDEPPPLIEEHSKAKLAVLRSYLRACFDRLNVNPQREEFKLDFGDMKTAHTDHLRKVLTERGHGIHDDKIVVRTGRFKEELSLRPARTASGSSSRCWIGPMCRGCAGSVASA